MRKTLSTATTGAMVLSLAMTTPALADPPPWNTVTKPTSATNPFVPEVCGFNLSLILDASGSIEQAGAVDQVRDAATSFLTALANTGSSARMVNFGSKAEVSAPMTEITTNSLAPGGTLGQALASYYSYPGGGVGPASPYWVYKVSPPNPALLNPLDPSSWVSIPPASAGTNWQESLELSVGSDPGPRADLVVFITDGDPNSVVSNGKSNQGMTPDPHPGAYLNGDADPLKAPLAWDYALYKGINAANGIKTGSAPTRMLAVGVGNALSSGQSLNNLKDAAGPNTGQPSANVWTGPGDGPFRVNTYGVSRVTDFADLAAALQQIATDLCSSSITIKKLAQSPTDSSYQPAAGWDMTVDPTISSGTYEWVTPDAGDPPGPKTVATDKSGQAQFQWQPSGNFGSSVKISETLKPDYAFKDATCRRLDNGVPSNEAPFVNGDAAFTQKDFTIPVGPQSIVTCTYRNDFVPDPKISVVKKTNDVEATEPGLELVHPDTVRWTYVVTNTGNVALKNISLSDDKLGKVTCPKTTLAVGESMTCTASGPTVIGDYNNTATVTGEDDRGTTVKDENRNQYVGLAPSIELIKKINGAGNLDRPDGSRIKVQEGDQLATTFAVTNTGNATLRDITLDDQKLPSGTPTAITCPQTTLAPGASMTCRIDDTALRGKHDDRATVKATGVFSDGKPLAYADGKPVPPVQAVSLAGYEASPVSPASLIRRRVLCRPVTPSAAGERAFCKVRLDKDTGKVQVKAFGYRQVKARVLISAPWPVTVKARKASTFPRGRFVTLVKSSTKASDAPQPFRWSRTWTLKRR